MALTFDEELQKLTDEQLHKLLGFLPMESGFGEWKSKVEMAIQLREKDNKLVERWKHVLNYTSEDTAPILNHNRNKVAKMLEELEENIKTWRLLPKNETRCMNICIPFLRRNWPITPIFNLEKEFNLGLGYIGVRVYDGSAKHGRRTTDQILLIPTEDDIF